MKKLYPLLYAITTLFLAFPVYGADWISIGKDKAGNELFYDREILIERSKNVIEVWMKGTYSDVGRRERIQDRKAGKSTIEHYEKLSYSLELQQMNCIKKEFRVLEYTDYSSDGGILYKSVSEQKPSEGWEPIIPDSMGERMYKTVCGSSSPKKR